MSGPYAPPDSRVLLVTYLGKLSGIVCLCRSNDTSGAPERLVGFPEESIRLAFFTEIKR